MHFQLFLPIIAGAVLSCAAPPPVQGFPSIVVVESFVSGQPARSCLIDPPNALGDNICLFDNNENPIICCPAGSACAPTVVSCRSCKLTEGPILTKYTLLRMISPNSLAFDPDPEYKARES